MMPCVSSSRNPPANFVQGAAVVEVGACNGQVALVSCAAAFGDSEVAATFNPCGTAP